MSNKQVADAEALMKEAKKISTRGLFNLSPDYDAAASKYEKAGTLFKVGRKPDQAVICFRLAGDNFLRTNSDYLAGKNYEQAANTLKDEKKIIEAIPDYELAGKTYLEGGKPDRCAEAWVKCAKLLEKEGPAYKDKCISLYERAIEVVTNDDKDHLATDTYRAFNAYLVREKYFREAIDNIKKQITSYRKLKQDSNLHKAYLSVIILHLALSDWAEADNCQHTFLEKTPDYGSTDEQYIASGLLNAFEKLDQKQLDEVLNNNKLKYLESEVAKLVKKLKISGSVAPTKTTTQTTKSQQKTAQKAALLGDSDDEEEEEPEPEPEQPNQEDEPDAFDPYDLT
ncbi:gamma-soluble NSF attachment protein SNPC [Acrasis kona]|uniref:Gamma-soluble NSF attachment protein n=1 Tax=Acrasis kona TaxID=1008807 RepID=A0AAW2Z8C2_9EUKA